MKFVETEDIIPNLDNVDYFRIGKTAYDDKREIQIFFSGGNEYTLEEQFESDEDALNHIREIIKSVTVRL